MSLFQIEDYPCPSCGAPVGFQVVYSVNADRRPDLRDSILDGSFQREICDQCGVDFRLEPSFTYLDEKCHWWILVKPVGSMETWDELEAVARYIYQDAYGEFASAAARAIGDNLNVRIAFGWAALREKILCATEGLDDVELELTKVAILRGVDGQPLDDGAELRLCGVEGDELLLAWLQGDTEQVLELQRVPRALYDEIAADQPSWQDLRAQVSAGPFVDLNRLLIPATTEAPAAESE